MPIRVETARFLESLKSTESAILTGVAIAAGAAIKATEASGKATRLWQDKTGRTRASIKGVYEGAGRGFVTFGGASRLLEHGTRAHVIHGKPILRFEIAGTVFYRRMVKHPGTAPRPFVSEAREAGERVFFLEAEHYVNQAIRRGR